MPYRFYPRPTLHCYPQYDLALTSSTKEAIYGVNEATICMQSSFIRDVLQVERIVNPSIGKWEDCPLVLPYEARDIQFVLDYCLGPKRSSYAFHDLRFLLRISLELGMREIRSIVIEAVYSHREFPHANKVEVLLFAAAYAVKEWFIPALQDILMMPLEELSKSDLTSLSFSWHGLLHHVIQERKRIETTSALVIVRCTKFIRAEDCHFNSAAYCKKQWGRFWRNIALPAIMDGHGGILSGQLMKDFEEGGMAACDACRGCWEFNWCSITSNTPAEDLSLRHMAKCGAQTVWDAISTEIEEGTGPRRLFSGSTTPL